MTKLMKRQKLHLFRIGLIPLFIFFLFYENSQLSAMAPIIFLVFWGVKMYTKYILSDEEKMPRH